MEYSREIVQQSPLDIEAQTEAGNHSGAGALQVSTTPSITAVALVAQMALLLPPQTNQMEYSIEIVQQSPLDIEAQTEAGHHSGAGAGSGDSALQVSTTPSEAAVALVAQMLLSVVTKTLGPVGPNTAQDPLFKVYTVANLTAFIIDFVLISYFALTMLSSHQVVRPTAQRMVVVKTLIWAAMVLSFISFLLGFFVLLTV